MARRLLQALTGVGLIYAGDQLLRSTPYHLSVWAKHDSPVPGEDWNAVGAIEGHIEINGIAEAIVLAGADKLTLQLEDGRRLRFSILDTGGRIAGQGGLEPA